jgi:hypothetical protein
VISTSKIKKTMAMRKNFNENDRRADLIGSNPHSKGEGFSRSCMNLDAMNEFNIINVNARIRAINTIMAMFLTP